MNSVFLTLMFLPSYHRIHGRFVGDAVIFGLDGIIITLELHKLNSKTSLQDGEDYLQRGIKNVAGCKNLKDCDVPKIKALALDAFPKSLMEDAIVPVKIVILLEQQTKKTDQKIGVSLMNAIMIALAACGRSQKTYGSTYKLVLSGTSQSKKMMKGVEEVVLSGVSNMDCVVAVTLKKFSRDHCQICQKMIPDFLDRHTAETMADSLKKSFAKKAPHYIKDYLSVIKTFAGNAAAYMDKLVVCKKGKSVESCRNKDEEATLCKRMLTMFKMGKQVMSFMSNIGTTITAEIKGFVGRVATTHQAYKQCLQSGAPVSINMSSNPVETNIIDEYEEKVRDYMKPLSDVVSRALQTKVRMLRQRRLQRARGMGNRR